MLVCLWRYAVSRNIIPGSLALGFLCKLLFLVQGGCILGMTDIAVSTAHDLENLLHLFFTRVGDCWLEVVSLSLYSTVEVSRSLVVAFSDSQS
jgi:hypothetical protein